ERRPAPARHFHHPRRLVVGGLPAAHDNRLPAPGLPACVPSLTPRRSTHVLRRPIPRTGRQLARAPRPAARLPPAPRPPPAAGRRARRRAGGPRVLARRVPAAPG